MNIRIRQAIRESIQAKEKLLNDPRLLETIAQVTAVCIEAYRQDRKLLFLWQWRQCSRCPALSR